MASYPSEVLIGSGRLRAAYALRPHEVLLQVDSAAGLLPPDALERFGLERVEYPELWPGRSLAANMHWVRTASPEELPGLARRLLADDRLAPRVTMASPVYVAEAQGPRSAIAPVPGKILIKFRGEPSIEEFATRHALRHDARMSGHLHAFHQFFLGEDSSPGSPPPVRARGDASVGPGEPSAAFDAQARLTRDPEVEVAELDWLVFFALQLAPSDTFWAEQWGMARIGMPAAWDVQVGGPGVVIGLPDTGLDLGHPDLLMTPVYTHFNAAEAETGPPPYDASTDSSFGGGHGTLVAGLAAAALDNALGVAGVAGGCPVLPAKALLPNARVAHLAAAVNWCVAKGARVINMSWQAPQSAVLADAIDNAWTAGAVLCAGAGNQPGAVEGPNSSVVFPAAHPRCIAVGAIDQDNQRKRPTSSDAEQWASCHGPDLDVCAPGVRLWSTDVRAGGGCNANFGAAMSWFGVNYASSGDATGDYFALWGGTSGATAHVSGLAALLMLKYPALSNQEVRDVIELTCTKISPELYAYTLDPGHPNGTWNNEVGHGLINAQAALTYADGGVGIIEPKGHKILQGQPDMPKSILARTGPVYQAAERLRQQRGAEWMARQPVESQEHGSVRLLIGTWDALAHAHTAAGGGDDHFFAINPFDLAWAALAPAVSILRRAHGPTYAGEFENAARLAQAWLKTSIGRRCRSNGGQGGGLFL